MITISLPIEQSQVPIEIDRLRTELKRIESERKVVENMLKAVQGCCSHPKKHTSHDYDGGSDTYCDICGKLI